MSSHDSFQPGSPHKDSGSSCQDSGSPCQDLGAAYRGRGRRLFWGLLVFFLVVGGIRLLHRGAPDPRRVTIQGEAWTTVWTVTVFADHRQRDAQEAIREAVQRELDFVEHTMSRFSTDSVLDRFNGHHSTEAFPVPRELAEVVALAQEISQNTQGAYDVTVTPLVRLWGFDRVRGLVRAPEPHALSEATQRVGYHRLEVSLDPPWLRKTHPRLELDLSSIAKGYGVDRVALALEEMGFQDYLVDIGGDLRVQGTKPGGVPWVIGVEKPLVDRHEVLRGLPLSRGGVASSGEYRNFYLLNGQQVSHTINPFTGHPVQHPPMVVTVLAPTATLADAWATAMNVLGPDAGLELAARLELAVLFVVEYDGVLQQRESPAFARHLAAPGVSGQETPEVTPPETPPRETPPPETP